MSLHLTDQERLALRWTIALLPVVVTLAAAILLATVVQPFFFILAMFFLAWILAFLLDPVVTSIVRRLPRLPRGLTAALVFFGLTLLILVGLVAIASSVLSSLTGLLGDTTSVPQAIDRLIGPLQTQLDSMGIDIDLTSAVSGAIAELQQSASDLLEQVVGGGVILFTQGTAIIFIAIVMVANKGRFLRFGQRLMPAGRETLLDEITVATSQSFGGFIRGQFGLAALYGVVVGIIGFVFGVPFVALIAVLTAALQSIPYFGQLDLLAAALRDDARVRAQRHRARDHRARGRAAGHPEHHLAPGAGVGGRPQPHPRPGRGVRGRPGRGCHRGRLRCPCRGGRCDAVQRMARPGPPARRGRSA